MKIIYWRMIFCCFFFVVVSLTKCAQESSYDCGLFKRKYSFLGYWETMKACNKFTVKCLYFWKLRDLFNDKLKCKFCYQEKIVFSIWTSLDRWKLNLIFVRKFHGYLAFDPLHNSPRSQHYTCKQRTENINSRFYEPWWIWNCRIFWQRTSKNSFTVCSFRRCSIIG